MCVKIYMMEVYIAVNMTFNNGISSDPHKLSFTFNTDGAPVFNVSVWPIYLVIKTRITLLLANEKRKMILSSLWFGCSNPTMGTFLKPFQKTLIELYTGIQCESQKEGIFKCLREVFCAINSVKWGACMLEV